MTVDRGNDGGPDLQLQFVHQQVEVNVTHGHAAGVELPIEILINRFVIYDAFLSEKLGVYALIVAKKLSTVRIHIPDIWSTEKFS